VLLLLLPLIFGTNGCAVQAKIVQHRHWELNNTIRETHNEQQLNVLRIRYDENPSEKKEIAWQWLKKLYFL
jgi:hypothetical protein